MPRVQAPVWTFFLRYLFFAWLAIEKFQFDIPSVIHNYKIIILINGYFLDKRALHFKITK